MNGSTFTRWQKTKVIAALILVAFIPIYSRRLNLVAIALVPAALEAILRRDYRHKESDERELGGQGGLCSKSVISDISRISLNATFSHISNSPK